MVAQFERSKSRDEADWSTVASCPRRSPVTTTASTPDAWISSASR